MNKALETYNKLKNDDEVVNIKDALKNNGELSKPTPIGYQIMDSAMQGGVRPADLVLFTGKSKTGKTTALMNISMNLSKNANPSLWFSYEILIDHFYNKFMSTGMKSEDLLVFTPKQNTSGNLEWIEEKIKEGLEKFGTKFIFIDHIEFLSPKNSKNYENYRLAMQGIARELKNLSIKYEVTIFIVSHVKKIYGRAVDMQDTSESGIYKECDFMLSTQRGCEEIDLNGIKTEILSDIGTIRMLANRLTGECPYFDYRIENNLLIPIFINHKSKSKINKKNEIEIDENKIGDVNINTMF